MAKREGGRQGRRSLNHHRFLFLSLLPFKHVPSYMSSRCSLCEAYKAKIFSNTMKSLPPRHVHGVLLGQFVNLCQRGMQNISFFTLWQLAVWRFAATLLELRACPAARLSHSKHVPSPARAAAAAPSPRAATTSRTSYAHQQ